MFYTNDKRGVKSFFSNSNADTNNDINVNTDFNVNNKLDINIPNDVKEHIYIMLQYREYNDKVFDEFVVLLNIFYNDKTNNNMSNVINTCTEITYGMPVEVMIDFYSQIDKLQLLMNRNYISNF